MLRKILLIAAAVALVAAPALNIRTVSAAGNGPEFGFSVGLDVDLPMTAQQYEDSLTILKRDIDIMAANNQTWVRLGIPAWAVAWYDGNMDFKVGTTDDTQEIEVLTYYERAIDYIRGSGLKLYLVLTEVPFQDSQFSQTEYTNHAQEYWTYIANRIANRAEVVQIYNEAQQYHYRFYNTPTDSAAYWAEMSNMLGIARNIFKTANPAIQVTTNGAGYPVTPAREADWLEFMDAVHSNLDVIALDLYPEDPEEIPYLATSVANAKARYNKPVIIAETGRHGYPDGFEPEPSRTYAGQEENIVKYMDTLRGSDAYAVMLYELRDSGTDTNDGEDMFGILDNSGVKKPSFDGIMYSMRPSVNNSNNGGSTPGSNNGNQAGKNNGTKSIKTSINNGTNSNKLSTIPGVPNTSIAVANTLSAIIGTGVVLLGLLIGAATYLSGKQNNTINKKKPTKGF